MIIKIKSHKRPSFEKLLNYLVNDKDRLFDKNGQSFAITHNLTGNSINEWKNQFKQNDLFRLRKRSDSVYLTHEILSWHNEDAKHITLAKMEEMAREYIQLRNPNGIYVAVPHFDKNHYHVHLCASGVEYRTGKSLRLPKQGLQKLKKDIQEFQITRFPELAKSVVGHGIKNPNRLTEKEYQAKLRTGRKTEKEQVISIIKSCYQKASSKKIFFKLLNDIGLSIYDRSGKTSGVIYKNYKFRFNRLGINDQWFEELVKTEKRHEGLTSARSLKRKVALEIER